MEFSACKGEKENRKTNNERNRKINYRRETG